MEPVRNRAQERAVAECSDRERELTGAAHVRAPGNPNGDAVPEDDDVAAVQRTEFLDLQHRGIRRQRLGAGEDGRHFAPTRDGTWTGGDEQGRRAIQVAGAGQRDQSVGDERGVWEGGFGRECDDVEANGGERDDEFAVLGRGARRIDPVALRVAGNRSRNASDGSRTITCMRSALQDGPRLLRVVDHEREHRTVAPPADEQVAVDVDAGVGQPPRYRRHSARPVVHFGEE